MGYLPGAAKRRQLFGSFGFHPTIITVPGQSVRPPPPQPNRGPPVGALRFESPRA